MRREPTNQQLLETAIALKRKGRQQKAPIWERAAEDLLKPKRSRVQVNLSRISRNTKSNDIVVIPGKVLGSGTLAHKVTVVAFKFSAGAKAKIEEAGGKALSLIDVTEKYPKGSKLKLLK